jgi:hypothetical protein
MTAPWTALVRSSRQPLGRDEHPPYNRCLTKRQSSIALERQFMDLKAVVR